MSRTPLVAANWKMNGTVKDNTAWVSAFLPRQDGLRCQRVVFAPHPYLSTLSAQLSGTSVQLGAQDLSEYDSGAYTGEVSGAMLCDVGAQWVLVGHSERRTLFGDTDARVVAKMRAALAHGLRPILCVGETLQERQSGQTLAVLERQLSSVLDALGAQALVTGALAYEPVWAIGTGCSATPEQAQQVHAQLRAIVARSDARTADEVRILYGGSVKPTNAASIFAMPDIDGGLVGGAALKADDFYTICATVA